MSDSDNATSQIKLMKVKFKYLVVFKANLKLVMIKEVDKNYQLFRILSFLTPFIDEKFNWNEIKPEFVSL